MRELAENCSEKNTIGPDDDAMKALMAMRKADTSRLMVVEGSKLVGMITLKDMMGLPALKIDLEQ